MELISHLCRLAFLFTLVSTSLGTPESFINAEKRLYRYLMQDSDYEKHVRPVQNATDTVKVDLGIALVNIADLNEEEHVLVTTLWKRMQWLDRQLSWDPANFSGITSIRLPAHQIWVPDIVPYNSVQDYSETVFDAMAVVDNEGSVLWIPVIRLRTLCPLDITYFPHDVQECMITFGSWVFSGFELDLEAFGGMHDVDLSDYTAHHEWDLINATGRIAVKYYPCCEEPYPSFQYKITLRRRPGYLNYVFVAPAAVMGLLVPVLFLLPPESGEKITLGTGLLLALVLLFMMLENFIPSAHPDMPLLGYYYVVCMIMTAISVGTSAVIVSIWYRSLARRAMPAPLRTVMNLLGRILFVTQDDVMDEAMASGRFHRLESTASADEGASKPGTITRHDSSLATMSQWRQLAFIVDRLCFIVFLFCMVVITAKMVSGK